MPNNAAVQHFTDFEFALVRASCLNACGFKAYITSRCGEWIVSAYESL